MPRSPLDEAVGVVTVTLLSNGEAIDAGTEFLSITVSKRVNRIASATLVMADGDMCRARFPLSDRADFKPGAEIEIKAGYQSREKTIFKGVVVRHGVKVDGDNFSRLNVECRDKAMAMTIGRKNANFVDQTDSDIIKTLIKKYAGLSSDIESTSFKHPQLVQYYTTDWDLMLARAEANGFLVVAADNKVTAKPPQTGGSAVLQATYGIDIIAFEAAMDARTQFKRVDAVGWDEAQQAIVKSAAAPAQLTAQGNIDAAGLAQVARLDAFRLQSVAPAKPDDLQAWAKGRQLRAALARIQGSVTFAGVADVEPGKLISLKGVGERFSGDVLVTGVTHRISRGQSLTDASFGLPPEGAAETMALTAPPATGLVPAAHGLQIGVVLALENDPLVDYRIKLRIPLLEAENEAVWARLGGFYASDGFGAFFLPEIGDEVVVGYLNDDPAHPVVLGSLYSAKRRPAYEPADANNIKAIRTRTGILVELDEEKDVVTIVTPAKNKLVLSDKGKSTLLADENGNKIETSPSGIAMASPKDITIQATGKISINATADVSIEGLNVTSKAQVALTAQGAATAELSASGNTTVKGALVTIN
jgi:Rhs element Vgr protein